MADITIKAEPLMVLENFRQWVNRAPYGYMKEQTGDSLLFLDSDNLVCTMGADIKSAKFPITIYKVLRPSKRKGAIRG